MSSSLRYPDKRFATESDRELQHRRRSRARAIQLLVRVLSPLDRAEPGKHGTFADCEKRLPYVAEMGFNVVYLPPIHPIGAPSARAATTLQKRQPAITAVRGPSARPKAGTSRFIRELGTAR